MGLSNSQQAKVNKIFRLKIPGLAYCQYCNNYVKIFDEWKFEFAKHFSEFSHQKYFVDQLMSYTYKNNGEKNKIKKRGKKQVQSVIGIESEKLENLFKYVKVREAYCQLCNNYINIEYCQSVRTQFWLHFLNNDSHAHFIDQLDINCVENNSEFEALKKNSGKQLLDKIARKLAEKQVLRMQSDFIGMLKKQYQNQLSLEKCGEEKSHQNQQQTKKALEIKGHQQVNENLYNEQIIEGKNKKSLYGKSHSQYNLRKNVNIKKHQLAINTQIKKRLKKY